MATTTLKQILNGEVFHRESFRQHSGLILLTAILLFIYILAGYNSAVQQRKATDLKQEVRELRYEYLTATAELTETTRQSHIAAELAQRGSKVGINKSPIIRIKK